MPRADRRGYEIGEPKVAHKRQGRGVEAVPVRLDRPGSQSVPLTVRWDSHASAYARSVTVHRSGSRHVPRLMSASALASHRVASALVLNVSARRDDARPARRTSPAIALRQSPPPDVPLPPRRSRLQGTVYECTECETRYLAEQWCPDCSLPCRRLGPGGSCPCCQETITIAEITDEETTDTSRNLADQQQAHP